MLAHVRFLMSEEAPVCFAPPIYHLPSLCSELFYLPCAWHPFCFDLCDGLSRTHSDFRFHYPIAVIRSQLESLKFSPPRKILLQSWSIRTILYSQSQADFLVQPPTVRKSQEIPAS